jgi:hypothetical protein
MNQTPKSESSQRMRVALKVWLIFFAIVGAALACADWAEYKIGKQPPLLFQGLLCVAIAAGAIGLWLAIRWLNCWRNVRRALIGLAVFATLAAIFYTEENWRGKRAWLQCKAELEAKGAVLDWNKYIPPHIPDDQNFFTVNTNFYLKFVKLQTAEQSEAAKRVQWLNLTNGFPIVNLDKLKPLIAEITVVAPTETTTAIHLQSSTAASQLQSALRNAVGRDANGFAGFKFTELQISNLVPAKITVLADSAPTIAELEKLIPATLFTNIGKLAVTATADPKHFQIRFTDGKVTAAAEYLAWGDQHYAADLDDVRAGLKRPYAIIPGDYSFPPQMPIPNFVLMRALVQTLGQRAQCHLMLGQPEQALRELALIHDVCRILQKPPTGQPETLVEAMINVAIHGLYVSTVQEGFRLHAWTEPQLAAIEQQLHEVDLLPWIPRALRNEQCHLTYLGEHTSFREIFAGSRIFGSSKPQTWHERLFSYRYDLLPRGWLYQNIVFATSLEEPLIESCNTADSVIHPEAVESSMSNLVKNITHWSPFGYLAAIAIPNITKAMQASTMNQTLANEAQIVCALERYKLANGNYPDSLAALVPQFIEKIPNDIIGGQPLHYQHTADGKFLLYSVGWNETDDDGVAGTLADVKKGDWVWPFPAK